MVSNSTNLQRKIALRRKLHILRALTNSKSVKKSCIIMDSLVYIYKLTLQLEAIQREYSNLMAIKRHYLYLMQHLQIPQEVKVEKIGEETYVVRVICKKGDHQTKLVSILGLFEDKGLNVLQAKVSCKYYFTMEAIVAPLNKLALDVTQLTQLINKAIV